MVIDALIRAAVSIIVQLLDFLPADPFGSFLVGFTTAYSAILPWLETAEHFTPLSMALGWFLACCAFVAARTVWRAMLLIYSMVPILGH